MTKAAGAPSGELRWGGGKKKKSPQMPLITAITANCPGSLSAEGQAGETERLRAYCVTVGLQCWQAPLCWKPPCSLGSCCGPAVLYRLARCGAAPSR